MLGLHDNQKRILEYLLDHQEGAPLDELAAHLGITKTAAKEHLLKIENLGYLSFRDVRGKIGRPRRYYFLSKEGHEAFPRQYSWLSTNLLEFLADDLGGASVARMMEKLAGRVASSMSDRFEVVRSIPERLGEVVKVMNELGYRATLKQSDLRKGAVIEATNCVYHSVAKAHPELCAFDVKFIESASGGMRVQLEACIARGDSVCRFCIKKSEPK